MSEPDPPVEVEEALVALGPPAYRLRQLIFETAEELGVGPLTETLKWGQPAYLTEATKAGTAIRLGKAAGKSALFFHCGTRLVSGFRRDFPTSFTFEGNRAIILSKGGSAVEQALVTCIGRALTYHRSKKKGKINAA